MYCGGPGDRESRMKTLRWGAVGGAALTLSLLGWSRDASAAGFAAQRIGGEQGGVIATNPTALYFNPGAMGFTGGGGLGMYTQVALRKVTYDRPAAPSDNMMGLSGIGNTGRASLFNVFGGPSLGAMARIGNLVVGFGFFAPFYGRAHWDKNDLSAGDKSQLAMEPAIIPLVQDGVQRWFPGAIDAELNVYYFTWGAAYRLGPLSIGGAFNAIYSKLVTTSGSNAQGRALPDTPHEYLAKLDADGIYGSFSAGAMVEAVPGQVFLGASYQAQPGLSTMQMKGTLTLDGTATGMSTTPPLPISFYESLPDVLRAGVRWRLKDAPWELRLLGDWTRWSEFTNQCITIGPAPCPIRTDGTEVVSPGTPPQVVQNYRRNWNDTYGVHLGASYWAMPDSEIFAGAWFETAAVPDSTMSPDLTDATSLTGALGFRYQASAGLYLTISYSHWQFVDRNNIGKSQLAVKNNTPVAIPTKTEDGGGIYKQWIGQAQANVEALFP
jgi:long-chain fatty acid transport protein